MSPTNADLNKVKKEITRVKKNRPDSQRRRQMRRRQGKEGTKKQTPPHAQAQNSNKDPANKKAHEGDGEILAIKVLIPSSAVAAIIGECGVVMNTLRKDHKCQIQISKNETYPGTLEQICIMKGSLRNILAVIESIQEKIRMKCADQVGNDAFDHANTLRIVETNFLDIRCLRT
ncbi:hypothetical protein CRE_09883 [Caenorhabditis remanei]|uniref:K Homology domain-containing protein n=1 Tax=Caenorhabditis remanei TaxID=31234 RepID=E3NLS7_CAERE|nr:hypothetical protein CRE_09883 [Caenorhabditis remanei]